MADVKKETVDKVAERIARNSNVGSEKATQIAREHAEKMNRERQQQKK